MKTRNISYFSRSNSLTCLMFYTSIDPNCCCINVWIIHWNPNKLTIIYQISFSNAFLVRNALYVVQILWLFPIIELAALVQAMVCLRDQTWLCVYCWCQTPEGVVSPRRAITRAQPDYNMIPPFFSTATNILLIKSNLKFESRATAVSVAMAPRYLGDKYRSHLHPRSRKCAC